MSEQTPFWLVWNPEGNAPTYKHPTPEMAHREAERLAAENPRYSFFVLEPISVAKKNNVSWTKFSHLYDDEIPF